MIVKQVYETADGRTFNDRNEAKAHEVELDCLDRLGKLLDTSLKTGRRDSILKHMLMEAPEVAALLREYSKRLPKETATVVPNAGTMRVSPITTTAAA
jgi:hypothetical protein